MTSVPRSHETVRQQRMFFVAGINGQVGGATARHLLGRGEQVRALVRDPQKAAGWSQRGVEVRGGDLNDAAALTASLDGVKGAFLMMLPTMAPAPGFPEAQATIASYAEALHKVPPPRLVVLSSFGSQQNSGLGNITSTHMLEEALKDVSFPSAYVRPGSFIENYIYGLQQAEATGAFDIFLVPTSRAVPMAATDDIGREIARLLAEGWQGKKIVELGTRISPDDLAQAMGEVLEKPVQVRATPREHWAAALGYMGIPPGSTSSYEEMMDGINSGWIDFGVPSADQVAGTTTPVQVFAQARKG